MNLKKKMTIKLTKIKRQTLKVPMLVVHLQCPACGTEFEMRSEPTDGETGNEKRLTLRSSKKT